MSTTKAFKLFVILIIFSAQFPRIFGETRINYVYDFGNILDSSEVSVINSLCHDVDEATSAEIVVVILENLDQFNGDINLARVEYFNNIPLDGITGIGKKDEDNGVLIIVSMTEKEWGIEVGYGLEGDLTDSESGRIGREIISPYFKNFEYYYGLFIAVATVSEEIGYNVEDFESSEELNGYDLDWVDIFFSEIDSIIFWLLGGYNDIGIILVVIIIIIVLLIRKGNLGGGRSGGGGAKGRW